MGTTYSFDTSALVKRSHVEEGTSHVDMVFAEPDATFIIASITIAELTAAIARLRTLDAIQLAVLLAVKTLSPVPLCSDARLLAAATAEGIAVQDPSAIT